VIQTLVFNQAQSRT